MLRSRFLWKLYAVYAVVILLSSLFVGGMVKKRVESETLDEVDRRLSSIALTLREGARQQIIDTAADPGMGAQPATHLQNDISRIGELLKVRLTVVRVDGLVLADSKESPERMENHAKRPEIMQALAEGSGSATRFSKTLGRALRYLAVPLAVDGKPLAVVRSSLPLTDLEDRLGRLQRAVFLGALLATLAALFLGFLHARRVTRPILSMVKAAEEIAAGDYEQRVHSPSRDELGTLARAFNTMSRELRGSVAALDTDRKKLTAILSSMEEGVVAVDRDERVVHINDVAADLLKVRSNQVLGRPIWEIARLREVSEVLGAVLKSSQTQNQVVCFPGSPERVLELRGTPLWAESGISGAVLILQDVSLLRHLETMRQDFVANVSHELKTPITAIRGMIETLLDDPEIDPRRRDRFLGRVLLQAQRMGTLVTDLLSLAHIESAEPFSDPVPVDLAESIRQTIQALQPVSEAKKVRIQADLPAETVWSLGDEELFDQAVANLLNNAIKFSPEGERVEVRLKIDGEDALIEVEDFGIGIEAEHRERLFERFYRVDKARSRELGGTGLGLAIVKHIALSMQGEVSVDSTPGSGSTFRLRLPISPEQ